jgi:uncharacterized protein (DUF362 family)
MDNSSGNDATRREALLSLLRLGGLGAGAAALGVGLSTRSQKPSDTAAPAAKRDFSVPAKPDLPEMSVIQNGEPAKLVRRAVDELGGIRRFVSRGDIVVVKPNVAWDRTPEQSANTNPEAVAEMVRMCLEAGAKKVIVTDVTINQAVRTFQRSGIGAAARAAGAEVLLPEERLFKSVDLKGDVLRSWQVFEPFLNADKMINMPVAKHHSLCYVTLGMKNWYGILGGPRHQLHQRIHESLADLANFMRPTLTVLDAYRVLLRNGPGGGALADVALKKTVVAGTDPVAIDAYAAKGFWNLGPEQLPYLKMAAAKRLGAVAFEKVRTRTASL